MTSPSTVTICGCELDHLSGAILLGGLEYPQETGFCGFPASDALLYKQPGPGTDLYLFAADGSTAHVCRHAEGKSYDSSAHAKKSEKPKRRMTSRLKGLLLRVLSRESAQWIPVDALSNPYQLHVEFRANGEVAVREEKDRLSMTHARGTTFGLTSLSNGLKVASANPDEVTLLAPDGGKERFVYDSQAWRRYVSLKRIPTDCVWRNWVFGSDGSLRYHAAKPSPQHMKPGEPFTLYFSESHVCWRGSGNEAPLFDHRDGSRIREYAYRSGQWYELTPAVLSPSGDRYRFYPIEFAPQESRRVVLPEVALFSDGGCEVAETVYDDGEPIDHTAADVWISREGKLGKWLICRRPQESKAFRFRFGTWEEERPTTDRDRWLSM